MKTAFMFSGQGAQYPGMGKELYDACPACKLIFDEADETLGFPITDICFHENEDLNKTEYTQPAILTVSIAAYQLVKDKKPDYLLGLSLGEYSALVASGAMRFHETVSLVRKRGKLMTEACPPGVGVMSAVMNLSRGLVLESCKEAEAFGVVSPANYNMPGQIVIAGEAAAVAKAEEAAMQKGAKRCIRLNVSGAFHTGLLKPASEQLAKELEGVHIGPMHTPVITNLTGDIIPATEDIAPTLAAQVMSPVEWEASIQKLIGLGVDTFVEIGPGKALSGFVKKIASAGGHTVQTVNIEDIKSFEETISRLQGA